MYHLSLVVQILPRLKITLKVTSDAVLTQSLCFLKDVIQILAYL